MSARDHPKSAPTQREEAKKNTTRSVRHAVTVSAVQLAPNIEHNTSNDRKIEPGHVVDDRWTVVGIIGMGAFGQIYQVCDKGSSQQFAMKTEPRYGGRNTQRMILEAKVLVKLQDHSFVPKVYASGDTNHINYLVMQMLSRNLSDLRRESINNHLSMNTAFRIIKQGVRALQELHAEGLLHRDIKPSNMAVGVSEETKRQLYIFDYGMVRRFVKQDGTTRPARQRAGFRGTLRYASLRVHKRFEQGPADDLWSLWYSGLEMLYGALPWRNVKEQHSVQRKKEQLEPYQFCQWLPRYIADIATYLETLTYETKPDYDLLNNYLERSIIEIGGDAQDPYDWETEYKTVEDERRTVRYNPQEAKLNNIPLLA